MESSLAHSSDELGRTEQQYEDDLRRVAELYTQGYARSEIAKTLSRDGREYLERHVVTDLAAIHKRWADAAPVSAMVAVQEELVANEALLSTAWRNYREAEEAVREIKDEVDEFDASSGVEFASEVPAKRTTAWRNTVLKMRAQAFREQEMWWNAVLKLRADRARLLGLISDNININVDNRQMVSLPSGGTMQVPPLVVVGFNPQEWNEVKSLNSGADILDGQYEDADSE
jgi:hypothetical protein